jgi:hypothetical protein
MGYAPTRLPLYLTTAKLIRCTTLSRTTSLRCQTSKVLARRLQEEVDVEGEFERLTQQRLQEVDAKVGSEVGRACNSIKNQREICDLCSSAERRCAGVAGGSKPTHQGFLKVACMHAHGYAWLA